MAGAPTEGDTPGLRARGPPRAEGVPRQFRWREPRESRRAARLAREGVVPEPRVNRPSSARRRHVLPLGLRLSDPESGRAGGPSRGPPAGGGRQHRGKGGAWAPRRPLRPSVSVGLGGRAPGSCAGAPGPGRLREGARGQRASSPVNGNSRCHLTRLNSPDIFRYFHFLLRWLKYSFFHYLLIEILFYYSYPPLIILQTYKATPFKCSRLFNPEVHECQLCVKMGSFKIIFR